MYDAHKTCVRSVKYLLLPVVTGRARRGPVILRTGNKKENCGETENASPLSTHIPMGVPRIVAIFTTPLKLQPRRVQSVAELLSHNAL